MTRWWNYPRRHLEMARRLRTDYPRWTYAEIARHLYVGGAPLYEPEELRRVVRALEKNEDRPPERSPEKVNKVKIPPPPPAPPIDLEEQAKSYRVAWHQHFPGEDWPDDEKEAIRRIMKKERGRIR